MEKIKCAAIQYSLKSDDTIRYTMGLHHSDCINNFSAMDIPIKERNINSEIQGFMTTLNRFVDRQEAYTIAENAGQIFITSNTKTLMSENVKYSSY